ncbi:MAG: hypothetical protein R3B47_18890 [Bacteroidia bacterium]
MGVSVAVNMRDDKGDFIEVGRRQNALAAVPTIFQGDEVAHIIDPHLVRKWFNQLLHPAADGLLKARRTGKGAKLAEQGNI